MNTLNFILGASLAPGDFTGFTFFIGSVSMLAATVFFLVQHGQVDKKFKDSMLVAALISGIAAVHYYYMRDQWAEGLGSPTELRYIDWILTVPLMVVAFALLTGVGMRKLFWASVIMLVTGYLGESGLAPVLPADLGWGLIAGLAYFWMAYEVGCFTLVGGPTGETGAALAKAGGKIPEAGKMLQRFVLVGWAIYPIGYMMGTDGWYSGLVAGIPFDMDVVYNIGDAINKIGFGMAVWYAAK